MARTEKNPEAYQETIKRDLTRSIERRHLILRLLIFILFFTCVYAAQKIDEVLPFIQMAIKKVDAVTTPFGIIYFDENPPQYLINHEECHLERLQEIGAVAYYSDYFFGGGCHEEARCNYVPSVDFIHPICSYQEYMGWEMPDFDTQFATAPNVYNGFGFETFFSILSDAVITQADAAFVPVIEPTE